MKIIIITISSQGLGFILRTANKAIHMISMMYWEVKHLFKHQHYLENSCQIIPCFISTLSRCSECSGWVEPRQSAVCEGKQQWRLFWNSSQVHTKLLFFQDVRNLWFDPIPDCPTDIFAGFPHRHTGKQNGIQ